VSSLRGSLGGPLAKRAAGALSLLASVGIMAAALVPGMVTGLASAPNTVDAGLFELDGNIAQNAATPPPWDWACLFPGTPSCNPTNPPMVGKIFQQDFGNPDPTYFSSNGAGVKDIGDLSTWGCVSLNNPLNKDDILNAYGAAFVPTSGPKQGHLLVYLAQERDSNNGDSFAGFWLMKSQHSCTDGGGFTGLHDVGDLLVVSNYEGGGDNQSVQLYEWNPSDPKAQNNLVELNTGGLCGGSGVDMTDMCAIANPSSLTEPWAPNLSLGTNQFLEEGVDLTDLIPPDLSNESSACFSDFLSETRSSQETTATLKDYTTGRFSFCLTPTVTTQQSAHGTTSAAMTITPGMAVSDQATLSGTISGTPGGTIEYKLFSGTACTGTPIYDSGALALSGGVVPSSGTTTAANAVGTYEWQAFYSGDISGGGHNRAGASACGDEPLTVVDASIAIGPSAVNQVGTAHVFTVTATAYVPSGTSVVFNSITADAVDGSNNHPATDTSTCGSPTVSGNTATCTLTINSATVDTFTANASATMTLGGLSVTRSTSGTHGPNGSGPATKAYVNATIAIGPPMAVNLVGAPHTFTVTVTALPGTTGTPSFGPVTYSVLDSHSNPPGSVSSTCGSPTVSGNTATCTITINNSTADTFTATATDTVTMGGLHVTVTTDGQNGNSGPAVKTYGDGAIVITPNAVNEVGSPHTFHITVTGLTGATTTFNSITASITPTPDLQDTSTCANPTITAGDSTHGDQAKCDVTINSSTAGVFTANATAHITVNGFSVVLTTDGQNGNSGPAIKTYVDGAIRITPHAAENEVNAPHTFTITATALPTGQTYLFAITPSISPTPDVTNTNTCGTPVISGNTATCTYTINSDTAGVFTLNASAVMTIDGKQITRSTSGNSGPADLGSGAATKTYVDAAVGISPHTAFNEIGHVHVFDIVVTAFPAGETPVSFVITPSVSDAGDVAPGDVSTTCDNPTVAPQNDGTVKATCTLTINNDVPDTFVANVAADVTMGGLTVHRSTDGNMGPGGTGPATKNYVTANIGLSPLSADDPVGDLHTLTATVTTNDGSGNNQPAPAPDGTVVSFSLVSGPGSLASPSCTISNGLGTCTDVLTSSVEGTSVINASVVITVDGVQLTRSTNDSVPGDSPNAVKNWHKVQPSITTAQSAGGTVGLTSVSDTATVSGGLNPTGTVTFQLFGAGDTTCSGTPVFISSDQPLSNGVAASGTFSPTATGTYEWVATYNGDDANLTAVSGCGDEPVTIVAAQVLGITTPNTGAGLMGALAEGLGLVLAGTGIVYLARRRRHSGD